jgi:epoxyqueuosine reductase QueG
MAIIHRHQDAWRNMKSSIASVQSDLQTAAREMGAGAFGVADLDELRKKVPDLLKHAGGGCCRAVVAGVRLQKAVLDEIVDKPTPLYFHLYRQANYTLDRIGFALAGRIQEAGYRALAVPASQVIGSEPMSGHISHKLLGWAAGIRHYGRSTLLVHPEYGAQMRYVSVLTDMPLAANKPFEGDCGSCRACMAVCPAKAIGQKREDFNLRACYEKLTEFTRLPFIGQHICGICVRACGGRRAEET